MDFIQMINIGEFVVLDTETTGLHRGEICSIAVIDANGETLLDTLVKTQRAIPLDATRIHGINDADVANAPTFDAIMPTLKDILTGRDVVVYNATYDRKMLHQSAEACGMPKTEWKELSQWWCAMEAFAPIYGDWNDWHGSFTYQKLTTAARYYGVEVNGAHSALGDCLMTLGVVKAMAAEGK